MRFTIHRNFDKKFKKLSPVIQRRFKERRNLFLTEPLHPLLNNHPLNSPFAGSRSINVTGDYRAIFRYLSQNSIIFIDIGTDHELFGS